MPTPIQSAPKPPPAPAPQRAVPMERPSAAPTAPAGPGEKRPALAVIGRGDTQTSRSTSNKSFAETPISPDGLFFSQLLVPAVSEERDQQGFAGGAVAFPVKSEAVPTQLIDEVAQRLPEQPEGPLNFTLLMPNLGTVRVNAEKTDNRWSIQLGFARRDVLKRLQGHVGACRDALSQAMGLDVDLDLHEEREA
ncbi:type III secretion system HrpP C-terminal domain-containing protein [Pseudomonas triticifolii]|uniref:Flagellar hook-length control protein FliK n=1 Tax=Pseudomonas triticifolii TaxID=2762592 RepID=A0ABR7BBQ7_9PSED|nr:type III secretion system HrpP C-terminal domain-containing protein [Pseudomonas triticifolii]MBC3954593.1 flagellar hook-length control protein FliK [Pseudomonas triticifolii]